MLQAQSRFHWQGSEYVPETCLPTKKKKKITLKINLLSETFLEKKKKNVLCLRLVQQIFLLMVRCTIKEMV